MPRPTRSRAPFSTEARAKMVRGGLPAGAAPLPRSAACPARRDDPASNLPPEIARQAQREMDRLRRLPSGSPEAGRVRATSSGSGRSRGSARAGEDADLKLVEKVLERDHLGLTKAKERIVEYLAVRKLKRRLCLARRCAWSVRPGTGKTSLGAAVARALDRPFVRITVSGTTDAGELRGISARTAGAQPGEIVRALRDRGRLQPVLDDRRRRPADRVRAASASSRAAARAARSREQRPFHRPVPRPAHGPLARRAGAVRQPSRRWCPIRCRSVSRSSRCRATARTRSSRSHAASWCRASSTITGLAPRDLTLGERRAAHDGPPLHARSRRARAGAPDRDRLPQGRARARHRRLAPPHRRGRTISSAISAIASTRRRAIGKERRGRRRARPGVDLDRRRGARGRGAQDAGRGTRDDHRPARRGDEGVGAGRALVRRARAPTCSRSTPRRSANYDIHIHFPAARRAQGRPVRRHHGRPRDRLGAERPADPPRRRDDRRGEPARQGAGRRRTAREGARRLPRRHPHHALPGGEREGRRATSRPTCASGSSWCPVETMDDVFNVALHRVIVPSRMNGNFVIEIDDDDEIEVESENEQPRARQERTPQRALARRLEASPTLEQLGARDRLPLREALRCPEFADVERRRLAVRHRSPRAAVRAPASASPRGPTSR